MYNSYEFFSSKIESILKLVEKVQEETMGLKDEMKKSYKEENGEAERENATNPKA